MLLDIPDVRQAHDYDCGAAVIDAVSIYFARRRGTLFELANPVQGMAPDTVEAVLRSVGFSVLSGTMTPEDLKHFCNTGRPVLCPVSTHGGHWVVVRGVIGLGLVFIHCPIDGRLQLSADEWAGVWRDVSRSGQLFERWGIAVSK